MTIVCSAMASPFGRLLFAERDGALVRLDFASSGGNADFEQRVRERDALGETVAWERDRRSPARTQLAEYCGGERTIFDLELQPRGTPFQQAVWQALRRIKWGSTCSYAELAAAIGKPTAVRAVGAANGRNPIAIVVPCHRVIGSDGSLTGYAGGLAMKRRLLVFEGAAIPVG